MKIVNFLNGMNFVLYTAWGIGVMMGDGGVSKQASIFLLFLIAFNALMNIWDNKTIEKHEKEIDKLKAGK